MLDTLAGYAHSYSHVTQRRTHVAPSHTSAQSITNHAGPCSTGDARVPVAPRGHGHVPSTRAITLSHSMSAPPANHVSSRSIRGTYRPCALPDPAHTPRCVLPTHRKRPPIQALAVTRLASTTSPEARRRLTSAPRSNTDVEAMSRRVPRRHRSSVVCPQAKARGCGGKAHT